MGRIGEEAALRVARPFEAREHRVQRRSEPADLVAGLGRRQPPPRIAGALDLRRGGGEPRQRPERAAHQHGDGDRSEPGGDETGQENVVLDAGDRVVDVEPRRRDDDRAAGGGPAEVRERRCVEPQPIRSERAIGVAAASVPDCVRHELTGRQSAPAERERARDDPAAPVDHLDRHLRPAERRVECAGRRQQRGCRRVQLRDLDRAFPQRPVERAVEMPRDEHVHDGAADDERQQDRERRRDDRSQLERPAAHRPKPAPRTVSISGGSPSLRRR